MSAKSSVQIFFGSIFSFIFLGKFIHPWRVFMCLFFLVNLIIRLFNQPYLVLDMTLKTPFNQKLEHQNCPSNELRLFATSTHLILLGILLLTSLFLPQLSCHTNWFLFQAIRWIFLRDDIWLKPQSTPRVGYGEIKHLIICAQQSEHLHGFCVCNSFLSVLNAPTISCCKVELVLISFVFRKTPQHPSSAQKLTGILASKC